MDFVGKGIAWLLGGLVFACVCIYAVVNTAIVGALETDIPANQVHYSAPIFDVDVYENDINVGVGTEITSDRAVSDFDATLVLYDCPSPASNIESCDQLASQTLPFTDATQPGVPYRLVKQFNFYGVASREGVLVPKLELTGFQG